jgi:4-aminobutyrate aminotransferase-like enzyme/Ser/Thr protein kinase RdoA (MazF antagonist)/murein DD-endopeptidase MepM/ murein hydrolase activator NlpD
MLIETRQSRRSTFSEAQQLARDLYGLDATATPLNGEFDDNFHLKTSENVEYALKIMRPGCDRALVDLQVAVLHHLRDLPVPRTVNHRGNTARNAARSGSPAVETTPDGRFVWLLEWLPGRLWADYRPHTPEMLANLGRMLGRVDRALEGFNDPAAHRELKWDLARADWINEYLHHIDDPKRRKLVQRAMLHHHILAASFECFRRGVIHGDANDHNIIVRDGKIAGLIDFGDVHYGAPVCELAIACAYAAFGENDPLAAIQHVVRGYREEYPLTPAELEAVFPLILTRLAVSVTNSAYLKTLDPEHSYVAISETHAWDALEKLSQVHPRLAAYLLGAPTPELDFANLSPRINLAPILEGIDLRTEPCIVFDLSVGSLLLSADPRNLESGAMTEIVFREMREANVRVGVGRYNEARAWYTTPAFAPPGPNRAHPTDEHRTIHLGLDLFAEAGTGVHAPLAGIVWSLTNNSLRLDYGPLIILRHEDSRGAEFFTLYGHLTLDSIDGLRPGQKIARGQRIGAIGSPPTNGEWAPHLHFQIVTDLLDLFSLFPGVAFASQRDVWLKLSPDPNLLIGIPADRFPQPELSKGAILATRRALLGGNLSVSYDEPLKIVRGWRQYLYDETGRAFLDCYNNVPLVGHSHPRVAEAVQRQIALLNTNTRYLHDTIARYAERLAALLPDPLRVCYFLNSASEANELALRLARNYTGRDDIIVLEHAYHGNTTTLVDISPYKFNGPGGRGKKPWVHVAPQPDPHRRDDPHAGAEYARAVAEILSGRQGVALPHMFIAESLPSVGGQVVFPPGYLAEVYKHVRAAGGVCIADEVQVGFGRLGKWFWGFQMQDTAEVKIVPDIVVFGKPMGNGFPLAGVVTTREIAAAFDNGMEFFSTYGGNPVACAAGLAVLDALEEEGLAENARIVGNYVMERLRAVQARQPIITDVRGAGLFLGVELATGEQASYVVNRLRDRGVLAGTDGPLHNVIKLRPPLIFSKEDADFFVRVFAEILAEDPLSA